MLTVPANHVDRIPYATRCGATVCDRRVGLLATAFLENEDGRALVSVGTWSDRLRQTVR
jgi:hypothetical protein